jgi:hypothetical protein
LLFLICQAGKALCLGREVRILLKEPVDGRLRKAEAFLAIVENEFACEQASPAPPVDRFCRDTQGIRQFFYTVNSLGLVSDRRGDLTA